MKGAQFYKQERKIANASIQLKSIKRQLERIMSLKALKSKRSSPKERSLYKEFNGPSSPNFSHGMPSEPINRFNTQNVNDLQTVRNIYSSQMRYLFANRNRVSRTLHAHQRFNSDQKQYNEDEELGLNRFGNPLAFRKGNLKIKEQQKEQKNTLMFEQNRSDGLLTYRQSEYSKRIRLHPRLNQIPKQDLEGNQNKDSKYEIIQEIMSEIQNLHSDNKQKALIILQLEKINSTEATRINNIEVKLNALQTQNQFAWNLNEKNRFGVMQMDRIHQLLKARCKIDTENTEQSFGELMKKEQTKDYQINNIFSQIERVMEQDANLKQRLEFAENKIKLKDQFIQEIIKHGKINSDFMHLHIQECNSIQDTQNGSFNFKKKCNYSKQVPRGNLR